MMSVIVTRSPTELSCDRRILQCTQLFLQAIDIYHHLFAQTCGRSRLSVCLCQHRHLFPLLRIVVQLFDEFLDHRIVHLFQCLLDAQGYAGVVDVLGCQAEVDEFLGLSGKAAEHRNFLLDEVFDGLDVVVSDLFDVLHTLSVLLREVTIDVAEGFKQAMVEILQLWQWQFTQGDEVLYLHANTIANQRILRKISCQFLCLFSVAAIYRRDGCQHV